MTKLRIKVFITFFKPVKSVISNNNLFFYAIKKHPFQFQFTKIKNSMLVKLFRSSWQLTQEFCQNLLWYLFFIFFILYTSLYISSSIKVILFHLVILIISKSLNVPYIQIKFFTKRLNFITFKIYSKLNQWINIFVNPKLLKTSHIF